MGFLYDKYCDKANNGDISWRDDDICFVLLDITKYTADQAADEFLSDIGGGAGGHLSSGGQQDVHGRGCRLRRPGV